MGKVTLAGSMQEVCEDMGRMFVAAGRNTVNAVAAIARKNAQANIGANFVLRNSFTMNSVFFTQCPKSVRTLSDIKSFVGITERAGYMALQETGGTKTNRNGGNLIIPNTRARVGGTNAKAVSRGKYYSSIRPGIVRGAGRFSSHKANFVAQAYVAFKNRGFVRRNDSIFAVQRFRKIGDSVSFQMKQIYNMKHQSVQVEQNPWLEPASDFAGNLMQDIFNKEMEKL